MNVRAVLNRLGFLLIMLAVAQSVPLAWATAAASADARAFVFSMAITSALGLGLYLRFPGADEPDLREAFATVVVAWFVAGILASLPFLFAGTFPGWVDALFESVSGLTTTGATVVTAVAAQPPGILMWRSMLQWLGGMGIIVLFIAVFPKLGIAGSQLLSAEFAGPLTEKLTPRIRQTAALLWRVYLMLSVLLFVALTAAGMSAYDAMLHTFSTVSTGGFSNRDLSIGAYGSPAVEWILILFMVLGGMNFALQYRAIWLRDLHRLNHAELKAYLLIIGVATALVAAALAADRTGGALFEKLRVALFHVVSTLTTSGYAVADVNAWPAAAQATLFLLYFIGGMGGSTSGGVKIIRYLVLAANMKRGFVHLLHPHATVALRIGDQPIQDRVLHGIVQFFFLYFVLIAVSVIVVATQGYDFMTTVSAVIASLGNVGPAFGMVGPHETYAFFAPWVKLYLAFLMIAGRLEVVTIFVMLLPELWRRRR